MTNKKQNTATSSASPVKKLPPMMTQYYRIKAEYPNTVLLYRMGDFYETFEDDAIIASKILGITLTKRNHGGTDETPLAGFPYHAIDKYAHKLVKAGYRVAVCEQIENPKTAKGVVKRDVIEVISSGTGVGDNFLDEKSDNNVLCVCEIGLGVEIGLALCDVSTGNFSVSVADISELGQKISQFQPNEILVSDKEENIIVKEIKKNYPEIPISFEQDYLFDIDSGKREVCEHFNAVSVNSLGLEDKDAAVIAASVLLQYLKKLKKNDLSHISKISIDTAEKYALLDAATIRNLELLKPIHTDETGGTLISVLDSTVTAVGSRLLKRWIVNPLADINEINERLDAVEFFCKDLQTRNEIESTLKQITDLERIIGKLSLQRINPRELDALKRSILLFPKIISLIKNCPQTIISQIAQKIDGLQECAEKIAQTIMQDPPLNVSDGNLICSGVSEELDNLRNIQRDAKGFIARLQEEERQNTGIDNLKVSFNNIFGYFFEVSKSQLGKVPDYFHRKQTLTTGERFITPKLKEFEEQVLGASERILALETKIFSDLKNFVAQFSPQIQEAAANLAILDVLCSFGKTASQNNYCRPKLSQNCNMLITDGRHPVVETMTGEPFVPNNTKLTAQTQILMITGPNMAGKSTYLRQNALIALMAQIGSFVPAKEANIGIVDRFFTRIGASDRLARGQSTFLVEMIEVANILNNATDKSLVLLDEVGRGTSTFDGMSIAWATAEYLHNKFATSVRTFFATHYHELAELSKECKRMENAHISVKEHNGNILFLRKIVGGSSPHSYGIKIAQLAGVPSSVIDRADEIMNTLEQQQQHDSALNLKSNADAGAVALNRSKNMQISIFETIAESEIEKKLHEIDINNLTPIAALNLIAELKKLC